MSTDFRSLIPAKFRRAYDQYSIAKQGFDFFKDILGLIGFLIPPLLGLFGFERAVQVSVDISQMNLPARLLAVVVSAAVMGFGLGFMIGWLTRRNTTVTVVLSGLLSIAWALLLTTIVDAVTPDAAGVILPEFTLFFLVGFALMLWCLTFQMRAQADVGNTGMVRDRSLMVLLFAASAVVSAILVRLGSAV